MEYINTKRRIKNSNNIKMNKKRTKNCYFTFFSWKTLKARDWSCDSLGDGWLQSSRIVFIPNFFKIYCFIKFTQRKWANWELDPRNNTILTPNRRHYFPLFLYRVPFLMTSSDRETCLKHWKTQIACPC